MPATVFWFFFSKKNPLKQPFMADDRRWTVLPLAQLLPSLTKPAYRRRSPATATLLADWPVIVGPAIAAQTEPRRLSAGQLTIACAGPVAMELQHLAPQLIERINAHAGQTLVERIRFTQSALNPRPTPPARTLPAIAPEPLPDMAPGELSDALARLRAAIRARDKARAGAAKPPPGALGER